MGFATFGANPIKNSRNPIDTATILFNFWETSAIVFVTQNKPFLNQAEFIAIPKQLNQKKSLKPFQFGRLI
jgi:hypothetical protein